MAQLVEQAPETGEEGMEVAWEGQVPRGAPHCLSLQWDLVCEQKDLSRAVSTFFFVGVLTGAVVFGYLADRWSEMWGFGHPLPLGWRVGLASWLCVLGSFASHGS